MSLTRRRLLKRTGLAALALVLGRPKVTPEPNPMLKQAWDGRVTDAGVTTWASTGPKGILWIQPDGPGGEKFHLSCHDVALPEYTWDMEMNWEQGG